jgi:DNA-directed RNA polymerase delta subunit
MRNKFHRLTASFTNGFLHTDTNFVQLGEDGVGRDKLTSNISLDDDDEKGCTVVVKGKQHRLDERVEEKQKWLTPLGKDRETSAIVFQMT